MTKKNHNGTAGNGLLGKIVVGCVFVVLMIVWQQYYFRAIDDVDASATTLWNWPTILLAAFGIGALALRIRRFVTRRRKK